MDKFDDMLSTLRAALRYDTTQSAPSADAPFGKGIADCMSFVLSEAEKLGFRVFNCGYYGYAEIGEGDLYAILGHIDTVPCGNDWTYPPFGAEINGGVLYGRGVLDDKGPIIACLYAAAEAAERGKTFKGRLRVIFGANEESGWACMKKYLENEEMPVFGFSPDSDFPVIICEKGVVSYKISIDKPKNLISLSAGERPNMVPDKSVALLRGVDGSVGEIICTGVSAHGSTPDKGVNAFYKFLKLMLNKGDDWKYLYSVLANTDGSGYSIACSDELSGALTLNAGTVSSDNDNIYVSLDIRHPIGVTRESIEYKLKERFGTDRVVQLAYHDPLYADPSDPMILGLIDVYREATGDMTPPLTIGGATYARALTRAVAFGPVFPHMESTIHRANECVNLTDLRKMYDIYLSSINRIF